MKKTLLLSLLLCTTVLLRGQQYTQGLAYDSTLNSGHYTGSGCNQPTLMDIRLDSSLFTYVTGMQFMVVFDTVQGVLIGPAGQIQSGDTFFLDAAHPHVYDAVNTGGINCWYHIVVAGTPAQAGENYPCALEVDQCTCFCLNIVIRASIFDTTTCHVDLPDFIPAAATGAQVHVFPNPATNIFAVTGLSGKTIVRVFDVWGNLVAAQEAGGTMTFDTQGWAAGIYLLKVSGEGEAEHAEKIVIAK